MGAGRGGRQKKFLRLEWHEDWDSIFGVTEHGRG